MRYARDVTNCRTVCKGETLPFVEGFSFDFLIIIYKNLQKASEKLHKLVTEFALQVREEDWGGLFPCMFLYCGGKNDANTTFFCPVKISKQNGKPSSVAHVHIDHCNSNLS